ncbi:MAG: 1,4-dihydroxy-2-naphthoate octaprenyltransferase [Parachlamydiaceae bacterium]
MDRVLKRLSMSSWVIAARPKTLSAGIMPVAVGTLFANKALSEIDWLAASCILLCSFFIQIATNLINDALDFQNGADTKDRLGPVRVTQAGLLPADRVLKGAWICFLITSVMGIPLILKGGLPLASLILSSMICSYLYTGGPLPLAYVGLGEFFVMLFYGLFATLASYFLQTGEWGGKEMLLIALELGCLINVLLAINNLRDIHEDQKANKKTLAARLGIGFARKEIVCFILIPFILNLFWIIQNKPLLFFLPMTALPMGLNIIRRIYQYTPGKIYNRFLADTSLLIVAYGTLLILAYRIMP